MKRHGAQATPSTPDRLTEQPTDTKETQIMKTEMTLVALEDAALETVAGGGGSLTPSLDIVQKEFNLDLDLDVDVRVVNFVGNQIVAQDYSTVDIDIDN